ncbi:MAG: hypothetical protein LC664_06950 [Flavobacteriales bacterium]|nr:hypothetical protein [Flavobacteriales bacterium]
MKNLFLALFVFPILFISCDPESAVSPVGAPVSTEVRLSYTIFTQNCENTYASMHMEGSGNPAADVHCFIYVDEWSNGQVVSTVDTKYLIIDNEIDGNYESLGYVEIPNNGTYAIQVSTEFDECVDCCNAFFGSCPNGYGRPIFESFPNYEINANSAFQYYYMYGTNEILECL